MILKNCEVLGCREFFTLANLMFLCWISSVRFNRLHLRVRRQKFKGSDDFVVSKEPLC